VLTHRNLPKIAVQPPLFPSLFGHAAPGETFFPMQDEVVHYAGQPVAGVGAAPPPPPPPPPPPGGATQ
jgi:xanthine dehydrogenase YagR molybdenum-binding subunit